MAIGNTLGRFIGVDEQALGAPDRKLGRVLVEVDVHSSLLETLEIQWRDQLFIQNLDYLGLPFRCMRCRRIGHLKNNCPSLLDEEESESSGLWKFPRCESLVVDSIARDYPLFEVQDSPPLPDTDSFIGKLKSFCLSLFHSLTTLENNVLDATCLGPRQIDFPFSSGQITNIDPAGRDSDTLNHLGTLSQSDDPGRRLS
jgi:hypothetical protein